MVKFRVLSGVVGVGFAAAQAFTGSAEAAQNWGTPPSLTASGRNQIELAQRRTETIPHCEDPQYYCSPPGKVVINGEERSIGDVQRENWQNWQNTLPPVSVPSSLGEARHTIQEYWGDAWNSTQEYLNNLWNQPPQTLQEQYQYQQPNN